MAEEQRKNTSEVYEIKIKGHLDTKWAEWFYDMTITHESDGTTTMLGPLPDQAVLHSVLERIRDMNLTLINVHKVNNSDKMESALNDLSGGYSEEATNGN